jgi:hypothetical protein
MKKNKPPSGPAQRKQNTFQKTPTCESLFTPPWPRKSLNKILENTADDEESEESKRARMEVDYANLLKGLFANFVTQNSARLLGKTLCRIFLRDVFVYAYKNKLLGKYSSSYFRDNESTFLAELTPFLRCAGEPMDTAFQVRDYATFKIQKLGRLYIFNGFKIALERITKDSCRLEWSSLGEQVIQVPKGFRLSELQQSRRSTIPYPKALTMFFPRHKQPTRLKKSLPIHDNFEDREIRLLEFLQDCRALESPQIEPFRVPLYFTDPPQSLSEGKTEDKYLSYIINQTPEEVLEIWKTNGIPRAVFIRLREALFKWWPKNLKEIRRRNAASKRLSINARKMSASSKTRGSKTRKTRKKK